MSADLISRSADLQRLENDGFELEVRGGFLLVHSVPYVRTSRTLARGTLVMALTLDHTGQSTATPGDHTAYFVGDIPCHRNGSALAAIINNSSPQHLGHGIVAGHYLSSKPEGTGRYESFYDKVVSYEGHIGRPARSLDSTANARTGKKVTAPGNDNPFCYPDTFSARYGLGEISDKLAIARLAIIGLGGTGSYILDQLAKTPVREIHLYDADQFLNHNAFRAPGAPDPNTIRGFPSKVAYFTEIYSRMHRGIVPHEYRLTSANIEELAGFDFVFVCVDSGSARQQIAAGLHRLAVPFIDSGIGVGAQDNMLDGCARATFIQPGCAWAEVEQLLPFGDDAEDGAYQSAIQIADLNAFTAIIAVMRWKRWATFYRDLRDERQAVYMVEGNMLSNRAA